MNLQKRGPAKYAVAIVSFICAAGIGETEAGVVSYTSRATFNAQGTPVENNNFTSYGAGFSFPGDPFTLGSVTYTSQTPPQLNPTNLVVGTGTTYLPIVNVLSSNWFSPLTGNIAGTFSMFGYDIGNLSSAGSENLTVYTNLNSSGYTLSAVAVPNANTSLDFHGWVTDNAGEWFTGFKIEPGSLSSFPSFTNVTLGDASRVVPPSGVPEPGSLIVFGTLGALAMFVGYRRRQVVA